MKPSEKCTLLGILDDGWAGLSDGARARLSAADFQMIAVGFVVSFVVAYYSVIWFLKFLNKSTLASFAYYRIVLAGFSYYYFFWH